jgi:hypothetical protein
MIPLVQVPWISSQVATFSLVRFRVTTEMLQVQSTSSPVKLMGRSSSQRCWWAREIATLKRAPSHWRMGNGPSLAKPRNQGPLVAVKPEAWPGVWMPRPRAHGWHAPPSSAWMACPALERMDGVDVVEPMRVRALVKGGSGSRGVTCRRTLPRASSQSRQSARRIPVSAGVENASARQLDRMRFQRINLGHTCAKPPVRVADD